MWEFFKPWRRKIGVMALLTACLFAAGWIRSTFILDSLSFYLGRHSETLFFSDGQSFYWGSFDSRGGHSVLSFPEWQSFPRKINVSPVSPFDGMPHVLWHWQSNGFGSVQLYSDDTSDHYTYWVIPYWSIVIPLTLLSAYLLLSKPRQAKKAETLPNTAN